MSPETNDARGKLTALWSAVLFNMIYADILGFLNADLLQSLLRGYAEEVRITDLLLVTAAIMVEIPILMVLLSRTLKPATYWWTTVTAVTLTTAFIIGGGSARPHYVVLATIELVLMALVVRQAWQWRAQVGRSSATLGR